MVHGGMHVEWLVAPARPDGEAGRVGGVAVMTISSGTASGQGGLGAGDVGLSQVLADGSAGRDGAAGDPTERAWPRDAGRRAGPSRPDTPRSSSDRGPTVDRADDAPARRDRREETAVSDSRG